MSALDLTTLFLSLKTAAAATVFAFVAGLAAARAMAGRQGRAASVVDALFLAPLVLPPTVVGFLLLVVFGAGSPVGRAIDLLFGSGLLFTWPATVVASTVVAFPLMYRTARGALEQVDDKLPAAARTLGASERRVFWRVVLPLARPGVFAGGVLAFARALGEFGATLMIAGNLPGRTRTLPLAIYVDVETGDMAHAAMLTVVVLVTTFLLVLLSNEWSRGWKLDRVRRSAATASEGNGHVGSAVPTASVATGRTSRSIDARVVRRFGDFSLDVTFSASRPVAIVGPSGSGKSLLLQCLAGLVRPDGGWIVVNGRPVFAGESGTHTVDVAARSRRVGLLLQGYALFPHLTVAENVAFGLWRVGGDERRRRVAAWLGAMDLTALAGRYPRQLSGGQAQRVALARAMATEPEMLLLDEPFGALDAYLKQRIELEVAAAVQAFPGITVLVTHDLEEAFRVAEDLIVLDRGSVVAAGPKHAVFADPQVVPAARLTGCKNIVTARAGADGVVEVPAWGCRLTTGRRLDADSARRLSHVGIRANHLRLDAGAEGRPPDAAGRNIFPCRLVSVSESPFRMTVRVRVDGFGQSSYEDQTGEPLQVEVAKDHWEAIGAGGRPLFVVLPPDRLMLLRDHP